MTVVKIEHLRTLHYCSGGVRRFFAQYGLDYADFLENGIESEHLLEKSGNDAMAVDAVKVAKGEL